MSSLFTIQTDSDGNTRMEVSRNIPWKLSPVMWQVSGEGRRTCHWLSEFVSCANVTTRLKDNTEQIVQSEDTGHGQPAVINVDRSAVVWRPSVFTHSHRRPPNVTNTRLNVTFASNHSSRSTHFTNHSETIWRRYGVTNITDGERRDSQLSFLWSFPPKLNHQNKWWQYTFLQTTNVLKLNFYLCCNLMFFLVTLLLFLFTWLCSVKTR